MKGILIHRHEKLQVRPKRNVVEAGGAVDEPAFREVVGEEEALAAAKAGAQARDPSVCWGTILTGLRSSSANGAERAAK